VILTSYPQSCKHQLRASISKEWETKDVLPNSLRTRSQCLLSLPCLRRNLGKETKTMSTHILPACAAVLLDSGRNWASDCPLLPKTPYPARLRFGVGGRNDMSLIIYEKGRQELCDEMKELIHFAKRHQRDLSGKSKTHQQCKEAGATSN
jgi:hypothetical protein